MKYVLVGLLFLVVAGTSLAQYRPVGPAYGYSWGPYGSFGQTSPLNYGNSGYGYYYNRNFGSTYYPSLTPYQSYNQFQFNYRYGYSYYGYRY